MSLRIPWLLFVRRFGGERAGNNEPAGCDFVLSRFLVFFMSEPVMT